MNVLKHFKKAALLTLLQNGVSQHEIARKTRVDRKTIRKYQSEFAGLDGGISNSPMATGFLEVSANRGPPTSASPPVAAPGVFQSSSACAAHHDWIAGEVAKSRNAVSIYQDLVERFGFTNGYNSVKRYVGRLKQKAPEQFDRLEFLPGEEAQVDYGQGAYTVQPKTSKRKRPRLFVLTLRYSRKSFRKVVWNSSQQTWAKLHEEAFRSFGGVPQYIVLDNLKEGVLKPDLYEPELNPIFAAMLAHYGVVADTCRVADPDRKGTVENAIKHTQDTALKGREFDTIEQQNEWLRHWEEHWAALRIHGRTKRQVQEMYLEEKPFLKALPLQGFRYFDEGIRTVWDDGLIEVFGVYYAAAPAELYSKVLVRIYETEIEIYNSRTLELYRRHPINVQRGSINWKEADRILNPSRMTDLFFNQAEKIGPKTKELCKILFAEQGRVGQRRMRGILSLAKRHSAQMIEAAAHIALERCVRSSKTVRELILRLEKEAQIKNETKQLLLPALTQAHALIRAPLDYARFFEEHSQIVIIKAENQPQEDTHADVDR